MFLLMFSLVLRVQGASCDISKLKKLPKIVLVGETHNDPSSAQTRSYLMELGREARLPVLTEVPPNEDFVFKPWLRESQLERSAKKAGAHGEKYSADNQLIFSLEPELGGIDDSYELERKNLLEWIRQKMI
ncbi:MAG: hypothetical protein C5B49_03500 [Bdellovibrio sp.]|nr:MAG: hypothetical protein C5B49_03500 [Bdellovibrio sp.]